MSTLKAVCADNYYIPKDYNPSKHVKLKEKLKHIS